MSQNENVSILARCEKKMPNADAGSLDDRRSPCQLIQIIVRLRPAHAKAVLEGRGQGGLFARETIRGGQEPKTKGGMPVWADSRWTLEKLQVEMPLVKGVNGFICRIRTGGQVQFGVRVLPDQLSEVRARMLPNDVRYTDDSRHIQELQQWRLGPLPYTMQPPEIVDMLLEWSRKAGVPRPVVPKAPDPRQRTKNGHFWFVAAEGPSLERDLVVERESPPDKGGDAREGNTKQVETERLDKTQRRERTWGGPVDDTGSMEQKHAYGTSSKHEQEEKQNGRWRETKIEEQISLIPVRHAGRRRTKRESDQTTGCIREDCAARDSMYSNKTRDQEPGGTHHRKSTGTENRMDQTEEAIRLTQHMQQRTEMMFQQFLARAQEEAGGK